MPWVPRPSERRRFPRFKADIPAIAGIFGDREIVSIRTRCRSISEGGVDAPGLQSNYQRNLIKRYCHLQPKEKGRRI